MKRDHFYQAITNILVSLYCDFFFVSSVVTGIHLLRYVNYYYQYKSLFTTFGRNVFKFWDFAFMLNFLITNYFKSLSIYKKSQYL